MPVRVCLVTTGQPSTDPRLVKEADALVEAGYRVHVIGAHWAAWADETDRRLLPSRTWTCDLVDWRREVNWGLFWKSRIRHRVARWGTGVRLIAAPCSETALNRVSPELISSAAAHRADLYIAHNLGALPAAAAAAKRHGARLGFDAEDLHRGQFVTQDEPAALAVQRIEERYLPRCDYVTAASPGIARRYEHLCRATPTVVLNVFPLADRPEAPVRREPSSPLRAYWFSQTIGRDRGLEDMVTAMGAVPDLPIELHLRGEWQPGYRDRLKTVAERAHVAWTRIVSHAVAAPAEMVRLAAAADVGLALEPGTTPNSDLALSNKIFAYLLAGMPVIATATTAQAALAEDLGLAAATFRPGDAAALAAILRDWCVAPERLRQARAAAWESGTTRFNWDRERHAFLNVVSDVLAAATAGRPLDRQAS